MFMAASGRHVPILFPEYLVHSEVAETVIRCFPEPADVLSAGFYNPATYETFGESETLRCASRPVDAAYIVLGDAASMTAAPMIEIIFDQWKAHHDET